MTDPAPAAPRLGRLGRTYQLDGALRCYPDGEPEAEIVRQAEALVVEGHGLLRLRFVRSHGAAFVVAFQGIRTPERAQALVNALVYADQDDAAALACRHAAEPLRAGLPVLLDAAPFGVVEAIVPGPQPLLRVRTAAGSYLLPSQAPYVVVHADRLELIDPPPGLLDDPEPG